MPSIHPGRFVLAFTLSLGLVACGDDDPTGNDGDELTEAEAEVMMEALVEAGGFGLGAFGAGGPAAVMASGPAAVPIGPLTEQCPGGGTVQVVGNYDVDDEAQNIEWVVTQTHQNCKATAPSNNTVWTFNGSPSVGLDFLVSITETSIEMEGGQEGAIAWQQGGRSGTCDIDVNYEFEVSEDLSSITGSVVGSVCGHSISDQVDVST